MIWIVAHFIASHLYVRLCTPNSIVGFLLSPLLVTSPHCISLRWLIYNGSLNINKMWILLGAWIVSKIKMYKYRERYSGNKRYRFMIL